MPGHAMRSEVKPKPNISKPGEPVDQKTVKFGPVHLEPGVTKWNARTYIWSAFWTIGFLSFLSFLQNYVLKQHLGIAQDQLGRAVGNLSFVGEIALLTTSPYFGALSDKIGRRPIFAFGFVWIGVGFALYPLAPSLNILLLIKMFMGVGAAMLGGMMATVLSDYPQNRSRGFMAAISGWANGLGALFMILVLSQLPKLFASAGVDAKMAGSYTFWTMTVIAMATAVIVFIGLKAGKPGQPQQRKKTVRLIREGFGAARKNPRLRLAFAESFIARGDLLMIGTFLSLWLIHTGTKVHGLPIEDATQHAGRMGAIVQASALVWAPLFAFILDRFDRATAVAIAMGLAAIGYGGMGLVEDPTVPAAVWPLILLGIGEFSAIMAGQALVAQEAPLNVRGSVLGVFAFCGALGVLAISKLGGYLYDSVGPAAPFVLVGGINGLIMLYALYVRIKTGYKSPKAKQV